MEWLRLVKSRYKSSKKFQNSIFYLTYICYVCNSSKKRNEASCGVPLKNFIHRMKLKVDFDT